MLTKLRQIAMMVNDLPEGIDLYGRILGMQPSRTGVLPQFGLDNAVLPAGNGTFVELLAPSDDNSAGARFLQRRGEAPYLMIFETDQYDRLIPHLRDLGVRITGETEHAEPHNNGSRSAFVHPASCNGAFIEIIEVTDPNNPWPAAGPDWQSSTHEPGTSQLRQMAVIVNDLDAAIAHWSRMFGLQPTRRFEISFTDLEIAVLPLTGGDTFIELAQPTSADSPSGRFLARYGEGLYLTIYEIADSLATDAYLQTQDIRFTTSRRTDNYVNLGFNSIWLHPATFKGAFTQLSQVLDAENPWPPAGDDWFRA
ncbi:MAG: VOC family protein [Chloroflexi bacterium]|nr:VOC family protein [Chloroflexota bacterium]